MFNNFFSNPRPTSFYEQPYGYGYPSSSSRFSQPIYVDPREQQYRNALRRQQQDEERRRRARASMYLPDDYSPYLREDEDEEPAYDYGMNRGNYPYSRGDPRAAMAQQEYTRQLQAQKRAQEERLRAMQEREMDSSRQRRSVSPPASSARSPSRTHIPIRDPSPPFASKPAPFHQKPRTIPVKPSVSVEQQEEAAAKIQAAYRIHRSLSTILSLERKFESLASAFTFPKTLDFQHPSSGVISVDTITGEVNPPNIALPDPPKLAYTSNNRPLHAHVEDLNRLLTSLDAIDSHGETKVRDRRKEIVRKIEAHLASIEGLESLDITPGAHDGWRGVWRKAVNISRQPEVKPSSPFREGSATGDYKGAASLNAAAVVVSGGNTELTSDTTITDSDVQKLDGAPMGFHTSTLNGPNSSPVPGM